MTAELNELGYRTTGDNILKGLRPWLWILNGNHLGLSLLNQERERGVAGYPLCQEVTLCCRGHPRCSPSALGVLSCSQVPEGLMPSLSHMPFTHTGPPRLKLTIFSLHGSPQASPLRTASPGPYEPRGSLAGFSHRPNAVPLCLLLRQRFLLSGCHFFPGTPLQDQSVPYHSI